MLNPLIRRSSAGREITLDKLVRKRDFEARVSEHGQTMRPDALTLVSGTEGSLDSILLVLPSLLLEADQYLSALSSLLEKISDTPEILICTHFTPCAAIPPALQNLLTVSGIDQARVTFVDLGELIAAPFAQDICIAAQSETAFSKLLEPSRFIREGDAEICDAIDENSGHVATTQLLEFQGGNCLVSGEKILLGFDHWDLTKQLNEEICLSSADVDVFSQFERYLDSSRDIIRLGGDRVQLPPVHFIQRETEFLTYFEAHYLPIALIGNYQPLFHIDMFVTPLGNVEDLLTILVADPVETPRSGGINLLKDLPFSHVVDQLESQRFNVIRNPITTAIAGKGRDVKVGNLLVSKTDDFKYIGEQAYSWGISSETFVALRPHYIQSWNNVLVERSPDGERVIMPTYNSSLDEQNRRIFESQKFTVDLLSDFSAFARLRGAAHCLVRDLKRGASSSDLEGLT